MSEEKISSGDVPRKFADWLLTMGCPPEKIPAMEKVTQMCRGQYYLVWRSLMEHVEAKDVIKQKRLQVFCDDIQRCRRAKTHRETVLEPEELLAWREHSYLKEQVISAEKSVSDLRQKLDIVMDKVSSKLTQRNLVRRDLQDAQRRVWLLQSVSQEMQVKMNNLVQTKAIADDMTMVDDGGDIKAKLDRWLSVGSRQVSPPSSRPIACSSMLSEHNASANNDPEDYLTSLMRAPAQALWAELYERRAALVKSLAEANSQDGDDRVDTTTATPQSILAHTAALHCSLSLAAVKHRLQLKHIHKRLEHAIGNLSDELSGLSCELLVLRCDQVRAEARVGSLRALRGHLLDCTGAFEVPGGETRPPAAGGRTIDNLDRTILRKKEDIKCLLMSLAKTERKIASVRETLLGVFKAFQKGADHNDTEICAQLELESGALAEIRQFYQQHIEKRSTKMDLSMELDMSENSMIEPNESNPTFVDELRFYLRRFVLENNRKLVLESGEKIWIFETLQASAERLHSKLLTDDVTCSVLCPSVSIADNLARIERDLSIKKEFESFVQKLESQEHRSLVDVSKVLNKEEEAELMDKIKLRLSGSIQSLLKTNKTLAHGRENMKLWSDNIWRKYTSNKRTLDGMTYSEYEAHYLDTLQPIS